MSQNVFITTRFELLSRHKYEFFTLPELPTSNHRDQTKFVSDQITDQQVLSFFVTACTAADKCYNKLLQLLKHPQPAKPTQERLAAAEQQRHAAAG